MITFANSLEPDQDRQNVGPDLDPNLLTLDSVSERIFERANFEKISRHFVGPDLNPNHLPL